MCSFTLGREGMQTHYLEKKRNAESGADSWDRKGFKGTGVTAVAVHIGLVRQPDFFLTLGSFHENRNQRSL